MEAMAHGNIHYWLAAYMIFMGASMIIIWLIDIFRGKFSGQGCFFQWRNESRDIMWPHILAEQLTAVLLIFAGILVIFSLPHAIDLTTISLGMLAYTSLNSLSWAFAKKERYAYSVPMLLGLAGSAFFLLYYIFL